VRGVGVGYDSGLQGLRSSAEKLAKYLKEKIEDDDERK